MAINEKKNGVIISYLTIILSTVINFAYVPILLGYMGTSEYGIYETMGSMIAYFSIMDFGLGSTITRFYSKYKSINDEKNMANVLAMCSRIYAIITVAILIAGTTIYFALDNIYSEQWTSFQIQSGKKVYIVLLISIAITIISQIFNSVISSHERFTFIKLATLIQTILQPVLVILVIKAHPTAFAMVIVMTLTNLILSLVKIYYCFKKLNMKIKLYRFEKTLLFSILGFSFYLFLTAVADQLFWRSNQLILSAVSGPETVALYAPPFKIFTAYTMISSVIFAIFLPMITSMVANKESDEKFSELFIKAGRLQFIALFSSLLGVGLIGKQFFILWIGDKLGEGSIDIMYLVTLLLITPFTIELIQNLGLVLLQARNRCKFRALVILSTAIITILIAIPVAINFGIIGCAFLSGCAFVVNSGIIMNVYFKKVMNLNIKLFWMEISKILIPGLLLFLILLVSFRYIEFSNILIDFIIKGSIFAISYMLVMWTFVMNSYEKSLIGGPFKKIFNVIKK